MRNILTLIRRYYVFFLFLALQVLALIILFTSNNYQRSEFVQQSNEIAGTIYGRRAKLSEYLRLGEINDKLSLENAQLRTLLPENFMATRTRLDSVKDTLNLQRYNYRTAKVINASVNRRKNYLVLDKGWEGGIGVDMGVIANGCLVGHVRSVSQHFSVVMPVLHSDFKASVRLKRSGFFGALVWGESKNPAVAELHDIPKNIPVQAGDTVFTSGFSTFFPANLLVGFVEEIDDSDNDYHLLRVRLAADFRKLDYVQVVSDLLKQEQEQLINQTQQQDDQNNP
jgi:rod shape-determining protein MreC